MGKEVECCKNCKYVKSNTFFEDDPLDREDEEETKTEYNCRRYPPSVDKYKYSGRSHIKVSEFNWCGEFAMTDQSIEEYVNPEIIRNPDTEPMSGAVKFNNKK